MKSMEKKAVTSADLPDWANVVLEGCLDDQNHLTELLYLSMGGLKDYLRVPKVIDELARLKQDHHFNSKEMRARIERQTEFAQNEIETGFPLLHAQAVISLWTGLEACIRNLVAAWLQNQPDAYKGDWAKKLRVRLGEYESLSSEEKAYYVTELL